MHPEVIDDRAALPNLTVPTLVVVGRYDVICGVRWAEELHMLIPESRLVVFERSGHFGHLEQANEFTLAVADFVVQPKAIVSRGWMTGSTSRPKCSAVAA